MSLKRFFTQWVSSDVTDIDQWVKWFPIIVTFEP